MENNLQIFNSVEFGKIRTIIKDDNVWFIGKDVAEALGYSNTSKAIITHIDKEDKQFLMLDIANSQNGNVPIGKNWIKKRQPTHPTKSLGTVYYQPTRTDKSIISFFVSTEKENI